MLPDWLTTIIILVVATICAVILINVLADNSAFDLLTAPEWAP